MINNRKKKNKQWSKNPDKASKTNDFKFPLRTRIMRNREIQTKAYSEEQTNLLPIYLFIFKKIEIRIQLNLLGTWKPRTWSVHSNMPKKNKKQKQKQENKDKNKRWLHGKGWRWSRIGFGRVSLVGESLQKLLCCCCCCCRCRDLEKQRQMRTVFASKIGSTYADGRDRSPGRPRTWRGGLGRERQFCLGRGATDVNLEFHSLSKLKKIPNIKKKTH